MNVFGSKDSASNAKAPVRPTPVSATEATRDQDSDYRDRHVREAAQSRQQGLESHVLQDYDFIYFWITNRNVERGVRQKLSKTF